MKAGKINNYYLIKIEKLKGTIKRKDELIIEIGERVDELRMVYDAMGVNQLDSAIDWVREA